jgi:ribosomal protein RSM22 (predicted rRNA methylase)
MRRRRNADEVARLLREADRDLAKGLTISDFCRKQGIAETKEKTRTKGKDMHRIASRTKKGKKGKDTQRIASRTKKEKTRTA